MAGPRSHCPAEWQRQLRASLDTVLGGHDRLLIGYPEIAAFLGRLGLRIQPRSLEAWHSRGAPIRPGTPGGHVPRQPPITSEFALTAWLLTSPHARLIRGGVGSRTRTRHAKGGPGLVAARRAPGSTDLDSGHALTAQPATSSHEVRG